MPLFCYRATHATGKIYRSQLECPSLQEAKNKLFEMGIVFLDIKEKRLKTHAKISYETLTNFTQQLAQLLDADLPLLESLELLKKQFNQGAFLNVLGVITDDIQQGLSFSQSLKKYPQYFDNLYCTLVKMGEENGRLAEALHRLYEELAQKGHIKRQVKAAIVYPAMLIAFCTLLISLLIYYIIPSLEELLDLSKTRSFTKTVILSCRHLKTMAPVYVMMILGVTFLLFRIFKKTSSKRHIDAISLKVPMIKSLILNLFLARWSSTMALLLKGGVQLLDALKITKHLHRNSVIYQTLNEIEDRVRQGSSLSCAVKKHLIFPDLAERMIFVGENTGELAASFDKLSTIYKEFVSLKLKKFLTLLTPMILAVMALIIGIVMLAILIPLTDINSLAI